MKKILIIEDELVVRSIYRRKFELSGYQVETAEEGSAALNILPTFKPDAIQVDIMLPGVDGVEVIRQIRSWPDFKSVPILVISSFYRPDLAKEAWKAGATKCVSKMDCTPNLALELVEQMLNEGSRSGPSLKLDMVAMPKEAIRMMPAESPWEEATKIRKRKDESAAAAPDPGMANPEVLPTPKPPKTPTLPSFSREAGGAKETTKPKFAQEAAAASDTSKTNFTKPDPGGTRHTTRPNFSRPPVTQKLSKSTSPSGGGAPAPSADAQWNDSKTPPEGNAAFRMEIRQEFLKRAPQIQTELRDRIGALLKSKSPTDQIALLRDLETSVSSLASLSGITGFSRISHISGAMDALIKDIHKKPEQMTSSVLRTVAHASDCLNMLFRDLEHAPRDVPQSMLILAVDDEPIARRTISVALAKANLRCIGMEDPNAALAVLKENAFDLIFLDAEMPGLNGFELCTQLRKLPTNKATPVIFVTSLTKFEVRAQSSLAGANDLIAKPFLMMELAVKALTYLLKPQPIVENKTK
jgi:CheY-like chemotaxis protein